MEKKEYEQMKADIIQRMGIPEYELNNPVNECATKLVELRNAFLRSKEETKKNIRLAQTVKTITENSQSRFMPIPEEVIRPEWLVPFNERQQRIVKRWTQNIKQTPAQIAEYLNMPLDTVKNTMSLEAFHLLRRHLTAGCKELLPLESILAIREVLGSSQDATKLKAALTVLMDIGVMKANALESENVRPEIVLDKELMEKLRKQGDEIV